MNHMQHVPTNRLQIQMHTRADLSYFAQSVPAFLWLAARVATSHTHNVKEICVPGIYHCTALIN